MKHFIYSILATILFTAAQAKSIKGRVTTTNGNAIEGATISILNTDKTAIADKDGSFSFTNISAGNYRLDISSVGFASQIKNVKVAAGDTSTINIALDPEKMFRQMKFDNAKDLVCGMPVTAGVADAAHYNGKVYGFCSKNCKDEFKKNPASYLSTK